MTTVAIWGGTGYAGSAIAGEARKRGLEVIAVSRSEATDPVEGGSSTSRAVSPRSNSSTNSRRSRTSWSLPFTRLESRRWPTSTATSSPPRDHGTRLAFVGGAGSSLVAEGGPRLIDTPEFHEEWKAEASAHAAILERLQAEDEGLDWFYVSPAAVFGSWAPGEATGTYRTGGDVLVTQEDGTSSISGADLALAFVDEILEPKHSRKRFTVGN